MVIKNENTTIRHGFLAESDEETPLDKESEKESYIVGSEIKPETEILNAKM